MAETIEYTSIVKFINEDLINEKIANGYKGQVGGGDSVQNVSNNNNDPKTPVNVKQTSDTTPDDIKEEEVKSFYNTVKLFIDGLPDYDLVQKHVNQTQSLLFGKANVSNVDKISIKKTSIVPHLSITLLVITALVYMNNRDEVIALSVFGSGLLVMGFLFRNKKLEEIKDDFMSIFQKTETESNSNPEIKNGGSLQGGMFGMSGLQIGGIILAIVALGALIYKRNDIWNYFNEGKSITDKAGLEAAIRARLQSGSAYSRTGAAFSFNPNTGNIEYAGKNTLKAISLTSSTHFGVSDILMRVDAGQVKFKVNGMDLDTVSYIQNRPVQTALVMAYLVKDKHFSRLSSNESGSKGESSDYVFNFEDDGSLRLSRKDGTGKLVEVESVSMAIRQQMSGDEDSAKKTMVQTCKKIFGVDKGLESPACAKHFYSILGKSALSMLQNMGETAAKNSSVIEALKNSEVNIKYEILKNLDWKMKISNGKKEMVDVSQWLYRLAQDSREGVQKLAQDYKNYLSAGNGVVVSDLLNFMVNHINTNSRLLDEKYKEAIQQQPETGSKKRRSRLTSAQIAALRGQTMNENNLLNTPYIIPGVPGALLYPNQNPYLLSGGDHHDSKFKRSFESIKQALASYNQKLSSETERRMEEKIRKIESLENELTNIHQNINKYTQILRKDRNAVLFGKVVSMNDIENLVNQYQVNSKEQTKQIVTLTTAFGKIKMLLETQNTNATKQSNLYDL